MKPLCTLAITGSSGLNDTWQADSRFCPQNVTVSVGTSRVNIW